MQELKTEATMKTLTQIRAGQRVAFERFGKSQTGTIVRTQSYSWAMGASSFTVLEDGSSHLVSFPWYGLPHVGEESIEEARKRYVAHLGQYPKWAEQLAAGIDPTSDWGDWSGMGRR